MRISRRVRRSPGTTVRVAAAIWIGALLLGAAPPAPAADAGGEALPARPADVRLEDLPLLDQEGRRVLFRSDAVGNRIAVIDVFFTSCGLVCPILTAIFSDLQELLGDRLGHEVVLVSISVDPATDIPARLKEYASRHEARPGWIFLTGEKPDVDRVLRGIGAYSADFADHPSTVLVGDASLGGWTRFFGFPTPEQVLSRIDELSARRRARAMGPVRP